jgi:hypothetical protein
MKEEIATELTDPLPTGGQPDAKTSEQAPNGGPATTIDVTEEAVGDPAAAAGSRQRKRTRGGQPD